MLKEIAIVTVMVGNLDAVEIAYKRDLHYEVVARGSVSSQMAANWDANEVAGHNYIIMQPESKEPVYLRFIETPHFDPEFVALRTTGWNAIEILARDPDAMAVRLHESADFQVVGEPAWLTEQENIKAMQATGPSNELLYLTNIKDPESSGFGLDGPSSFVDRVFIMVVGGSSLEELRTFYSNAFDLTVTEPANYRIRILSRTYGLPIETKHPIAVVPISKRFLLELDQYPDSTVPRPVQDGDLPGGIAMVSFVVESLNDSDLPFFAMPSMIDAFPYDGRRSATLRGPAGELIELIEADR